MTLLIPLAAVPSQTLAVALAGQSCRIHVFAKSTGVFLDLYKNDVPVVLGVPVINMVRVVRSGYLGFAGDLYFYDTQGSSDPEYAGLGSRYVLLYQ